jgi:hypothetical protein
MGGVVAALGAARRPMARGVRGVLSWIVFLDENNSVKLGPGGFWVVEGASAGELREYLRSGASWFGFCSSRY